MDPRWRRAAAVGGVWAAAEITLGSFLHNVRLPLGGQFMTAVGVALLAASHRREPRRGVLWRAGLVCAALKSASPSAVLLTPMIAIAMEGALMESGVALAGGGAGRALGGALAMLWTCAHPLVRIGLFYGADGLRVYEAAWERARSALGWPVSGWAVLAALAAAHGLAGAAAALAGGRVPAARRSAEAAGRPAARSPTPPPRWRTSGATLAANLAVMVALLAACRALSLAAAAAAVGAAAAVWCWGYPAAVRRLARPGVWLGIAAMGTAAGWLLGRGPEPGLRMALRALALTGGFAALSQDAAGAAEGAFRRWGLGGWAGAVRAAFDSLPAVVERMPPPRELLLRPAASAGALLDAID